MESFFEQAPTKKWRKRPSFRKHMEQQALKLSLAVYRVTNLFPQGEALTYQIRHIANQIVADLAADNKEAAIKDIKALIQYFQVARAQNWTKELNFEVLAKEYKEMLNKLSPPKPVKKRPPKLKEEKKIEFILNNPRQEDIVRQIRQLGDFSISSLSKLFPKLSRRTLNRDLEYLCSVNCLVKSGKGRGITYRLAGKKII